MPNILAFPPSRTERAKSTAPDLAFATLPLLNKLRDALATAAKSLDRARKIRTWGVPKLFFFNAAAQAEYEQQKPTRRVGWDELTDLLVDTLLLMAESADVRRSARATPGLYEAAKRMSAELASAAQLAELLRMPEGEAIRVIHPAAGAGYRILTHGVATVQQFHTLLADRIPGERPSPDAVSAAGEVDPLAEEVIAEARFQFLRPSALQTDGTIPEGFRSSDHWFWGSESLAEFPLENGERIVLIDEPTIVSCYAVERRFPRIPAEVEVLETMSRGAVERWLKARCPDYAPRPVRRARERFAA